MSDGSKTQGRTSSAVDRTARRPTLEDVAREAGVSRALVSIVVRGAPGASEGTRARVMAVADDLGYRPDVRARMLARSATRLIGVTYSVRSMHHADLLAPIYAAAEGAGYDVILSGRTPCHDERRALDTLLGYRCDALLLLGAESSDVELARLASAIPVVVIGRRAVRTDEAIDSVRTDDAAGMRLAVEHLVARGHARIVHVDGGRGVKAADRRRGYRRAMIDAGLHASVAVTAGGETAEAGRRATERLVSREVSTGAPGSTDDPGATAVIAYNDDCAWGVMRALADRGLHVPGDLSVVGYDGSELSRSAPRELTTVRQDAETMARIAVARAVVRLEGGSPERKDVVLQPTFVVGETTGPVRIDSRRLQDPPPPVPR